MSRAAFVEHVVTLAVCLTWLPLRRSDAAWQAAWQSVQGQSSCPAAVEQSSSEPLSGPWPAWLSHELQPLADSSRPQPGLQSAAPQQTEAWPAAATMPLGTRCFGLLCWHCSHGAVSLCRQRLKPWHATSCDPSVQVLSVAGVLSAALLCRAGAAPYQLPAALSGRERWRPPDSGRAPGFGRQPRHVRQVLLSLNAAKQACSTSCPKNAFQLVCCEPACS